MAASTRVQYPDTPIGNVASGVQGAQDIKGEIFRAYAENPHIQNYGGLVGSFRLAAQDVGDVLKTSFKWAKSLYQDLTADGAGKSTETPAPNSTPDPKKPATAGDATATAPAGLVRYKLPDGSYVNVAEATPGAFGNAITNYMKEVQQTPTMGGAKTQAKTSEVAGSASDPLLGFLAPYSGNPELSGYAAKVLRFYTQVEGGPDEIAKRLQNPKYAEGVRTVISDHILRL